MADGLVAVMAVSLGQKMVGLWAVEKASQLDESEAAEKAD